MELRKPTSADAPQLAKILVEAFAGIARQHNFPLDFPDPAMAGRLLEFFIHHPKGAGFLAEQDGKILGSNFLDGRDEIAAVGPITVDPNSQSKGVGRRLMQAVIDAGKDHVGLRLVQDAFNTASMSLYTSLGFDAKEPLALMNGKPMSPPELTGGAEARQMREEDLAGCAVLCRRVHGIERTNELRDAISMFRPFVLARGGKVVAYMSAPTFWFLNHGVAETREDLQQLLAAAGATERAADAARSVAPGGPVPLVPRARPADGQADDADGDARVSRAEGGVVSVGGVLAALGWAMPRRPFPVHPRGPRRRRVKHETILLACPRVAPDWELGALRALMKPQTRGAILHRKATQPWDADARRAIEASVRDAGERVGFDAELHFPAAGDYLFVCEIDRRACEEAKGFVVLASSRLPELWFVIGRVFVKGGKFYRRARGFKLHLGPASNVHLTRPIRAALRNLL